MLSVLSNLWHDRQDVLSLISTIDGRWWWENGYLHKRCSYREAFSDLKPKPRNRLSVSALRNSSYRSVSWSDANHICQLAPSRSESFTSAFLLFFHLSFSVPSFLTFFQNYFFLLYLLWREHKVFTPQWNTDLFFVTAEVCFEYVVSFIANVHGLLWIIKTFQVLFSITGCFSSRPISTNHCVLVTASTWTCVKMD